MRTGEFGTEDEVWEKLVKAIGKQGELDLFTVAGLKGMIACWHAHVRALLWVEKSEEVKAGGGVLILEDGESCPCSISVQVAPQASLKPHRFFCS